MDCFAELAQTHHAWFVAYVEAGFSEDQALKLLALNFSTSELWEGMPSTLGANTGDDHE